jgi:hypothetical protein
VHGLDRQRAYQIICLMVGSDREHFGELADRVRMPRDRQRTCANDYEDAKYAWHSLLESHRRADGEPTATIETAYEAGQGNLERYARSFQSVALLEALSDYASSRYALPRPIKMVMASCGDANAAWVSSANTEILCYELADDFFDLYDGYTTNGKVQDHGLVSKNVAWISLALDKVAMEMDGCCRCAVHQEGQTRLRQRQAASGEVSAGQRRSTSGPDIDLRRLGDRMNGYQCYPMPAFGMSPAAQIAADFVHRGSRQTWARSGHFRLCQKGAALDHISWRMSTPRPVRKLIGAKMPGLTASPFLTDTFLHGEL